MFGARAQVSRTSKLSIYINVEKLCTTSGRTNSNSFRRRSSCAVERPVSAYRLTEKHLPVSSTTKEVYYQSLLFLSPAPTSRFSFLFISSPGEIFSRTIQFFNHARFDVVRADGRREPQKKPAVQVRRRTRESRFPPLRALSGT